MSSSVKRSSSAKRMQSGGTPAGSRAKGSQNPASSGGKPLLPDAPIHDSKSQQRGGVQLPPPSSDKKTSQSEEKRRLPVPYEVKPPAEGSGEPYAIDFVVEGKAYTATFVEDGTDLIQKNVDNGDFIKSLVKLCGGAAQRVERKKPNFTELMVPTKGDLTVITGDQKETIKAPKSVDEKRKNLRKLLGFFARCKLVLKRKRTPAVKKESSLSEFQHNPSPKQKPRMQALSAESGAPPPRQERVVGLEESSPKPLAGLLAQCKPIDPPAPMTIMQAMAANPKQERVEGRATKGTGSADNQAILTPAGFGEFLRKSIAEELDNYDDKGLRKALQRCDLFSQSHSDLRNAINEKLDKSSTKELVSLLTGSTFLRRVYENYVKETADSHPGEVLLAMAGSSSARGNVRDKLKSIIIDYHCRVNPPPSPSDHLKNSFSGCEIYKDVVGDNDDTEFEKYEADLRSALKKQFEELSIEDLVRKLQGSVFLKQIYGDFQDNAVRSPKPEMIMEALAAENDAPRPKQER